MLRLHMIPTNGDATLLRFKDGGQELFVLIDGGNRKTDCLAYLKAQGVDQIHLMIASHLDEDHIRGLRSVSEEVPVEELWITDVSAFVRPVAESIFSLKCVLEAGLLVESRGLRYSRKVAVYDGYRKQLGPFCLEVLSPPKGLHDYLRRPNEIERILRSSKGQSIRRYIRDRIEKRLREEGVWENRERWDGVVREEIGKFEVEIPQRAEIEGLLEMEDLDWKALDRYYESARSLFNDISIVVKITFDYAGIKESFLFPGDLTNWSLLMLSHRNCIRECVTKVPHHGSHIYVHGEEYSQYLLSQADPQYFGLELILRRIHPWNQYDYLRHYSEKFSLGRAWSLRKIWTKDFWRGQFIDLNSNDVYEHLSPRHSLIYPLKGHRLPLLNVRNAIVRNSVKVSCNFAPMDTWGLRRFGRESCMDCYRCIERKAATVLRWA